MKKQELNINDLTPTQKEELMEQLKKEQKDAEEKRKADRGALKEISGVAVEDMTAALFDVSKLLANVKTLVFDSFESIIELKRSVYEVKEDQQSHTFSSTDGNKRITLGYRVTDSYDDTASLGIAKIKEYLQSLSVDENTATLIDFINSLLRKDAKGNLKASRVLELQQMTNKIQDAGFIDGVKILSDAYSPCRSCYFIEMQVKDDKGNWNNVPLSISSVALLN